MKRKILSLSLCLLLLCFLPGCGETTMDNHKALALEEEGTWEERYSVDYMDPNKPYAKVSINVLKEMSEEEMLTILDYYRLELQTVDSEIKEEDAVVYGVFYKGDTDEEVARFKYVDGESVEIKEEEQSYFPAPALKSDFDEE